MPHKQTLTALIVVGLIAAAVLGIEAVKQDVPRGSAPAQNVILDQNERATMKARTYDVAKEITTPDGFINTDAFKLSDYIGKKVILVDFWTYSCINCQRTLPYLNAWHEKYADDGLLIIGVHTPEFEFEKEYDNVLKATEKYAVSYPVVLDNDYSTWTAYKNRYWPRKYLIDIDGYIVYNHIGEGGYGETEEKIVELLNERKQVLGEEGSVFVKAGEPTGTQDVDFEQVATPETYLGAARIQYLINLPNVSCLSGSCTYSFSNMKDFRGYELMGAWKLDDETASLESDTGALRITFTASKVNLVAGSDTPVRARILVDGKPVDSLSSGSDVENGIVTFTEHDLYNLVDLNGTYESHILEIQFLDPGISAFAFTFG